MAVLREIVVIKADGSIAIEDGQEDSLNFLVGRYETLPGPQELLILRRQGEVNGRRVLMAGEIVSSQTVLETINVIASQGWRGELLLYGPDSFRKLLIVRGALKSAFSQVPSERLGELLVSFGAMSAHELAECLQVVSTERRFGEVAIEKGFLTREELFGMLGMQAERIFQNAVVMDQGSYVFTEVTEDSETTNMHHLPIQGLLMESVQRIDEMAHFREKIPSGDLRPVLTERGSRTTLDGQLRVIAQHMDGRMSILDLARELREDEFRVTKKIAQLMQIGAVELIEEERVDPQTVGEIIEVANDVLGEILRTVDAYGNVKDMIWNLREWTRDSALGPFFSESLGESGLLDPAKTFSALAGVEQPKLQQLQQAVHQLVSFAMFTAGPIIPRETEPQLARRINARLKALTGMAGARETLS